MLHQPKPQLNNTVLQLSGIQKYFGTVPAVENVDLSVGQNQLVTLLGPSGCGKTTTLRMIAGFEYPTSGQIIIDGKDVTYLAPNKREIRNRLPELQPLSPPTGIRQRRLRTQASGR